MIYSIVSVHYHNNDESSYIEHVVGYEHDNQGNFNDGDPKEWTRNTVVDAIERKKLQFNTLVHTQNGWIWGERVGVINVKNVKYLRTDSNNTPSDNLGNLPKYTK